MLVIYFVISWGFASVGRYAERRLVRDARGRPAAGPVRAMAA